MKNKKIKKIITLLMVLAMSLVSVQSIHGASDQEIQNLFDYSIVNSNQIRIDKYKGGPVENLVIPESIDGMPVTKIKSYSFKSTGLSGSIIIPKYITHIEANAFAENSITSVEFKGSNNIQFNSAFYNNNITEVIFPSGFNYAKGSSVINNQETNITIDLRDTGLTVPISSYVNIVSDGNIKFTTNTSNVNVVGDTLVFNNKGEKFDFILRLSIDGYSIANFTVHAIHDQSYLDVFDSEIPLNSHWNPQNNFNYAITSTGQRLNSYNESYAGKGVTVIGDVNTAIPGVYPITYIVGSVSETIKVTVLKRPEIQVKDSELFVGDTWSPIDNFVSAKDKYGNPVSFNDISVIGSVDTSKAGTYTITYTYDGVETKVKVNVLQVLTEIEANDSELFVGDTWSPIDNFVSAKDKYGNPVSFNDISVIGSVDTSKAGTYTITYTYGGVETKVKVKVLKNLKDLETKDIDIFEGSTWSPIDNFVSAKDKYGNPVEFDEISVAGRVDTSKAGTYTITYTYDGIQSKVIVKVKKENKDTNTFNKENGNIEKDEFIYQGANRLPSTGVKNYLDMLGILCMLIGLSMICIRNYSENKT